MKERSESTSSHLRQFTSTNEAIAEPGAAGVVRRLPWALAAGALSLAAFPPVGLWWTAPFGVAALLRAVDGLRPRHAWVVAASGYLVMFLPLLEWVRFLGIGPWLALAVLQAAVAGLLGPLVVVVSRLASGRTVLRLVGLVGAVIAVEALRARAPFGGLTWGRLAFGQSDGPLLPWAALGGAPLVGALVAVLGLGLVEALRRRPRVTVPLLALPFLGAFAVPVPSDGTLVQVAAVQGNVPRSGVEAFAEDLLVLDNHLRQTQRLAAEVLAGQRPRPDLVLWPENASDQDPRSEPQSRARLDDAAAALGQPFLLGAVLRDADDRVSNGLLVWGAGGVREPIYRKRHLVPFGEYLPLRTLAERVYPEASTLLARDFSPGRRVGLVPLNGVPLAVGTCFEVAFDDLPREAVRAGGELLVLPSNNASCGRSAQSAQQLAMARLRAVEHGRSTVVPTTSGISALIRPDGQVVARSDLYEPALLQAALPRRTALTVATRWGGQVEAGLVALLLVPALAGLRRWPTPGASSSGRRIIDERHYRRRVASIGEREGRQPERAARRRTSRRRLGVAVAVCSAVGVMAVLVTGSDRDGRRPREGIDAGGPPRPVTEFPEAERGQPVVLAGRDLAGVAVDTTAMRGNPVVLNVWGSWCAPCRTEAPALRVVSTEFAGRGVRFLGINVKDNAAAARAFERRFQIPYPSLDDSQGKASLALSSHVPASVVPATLVLDRRGRVAARVLGATDASVLRSLLDALTAEA